MAERLLPRLGFSLLVAVLILSRWADLASAHPMEPGVSIGEFHVREPLGAHVPEPLELTVEVSYKGLNHHSDLEIDAVVGQEIEITFVWADEAVPDNAHRLLVKGYGLQTELLDSDNREATLRFVADRVGTFEVVCDWRCEGHTSALQGAKLIVADPHPGDQVTLIPTSLLLAPVAAPDSSAVTLSATLTDTAGAPVAGAPVRFYLRTSFVGVEGDAEVAAVLTDDAGAARATYRPTSDGEHLFVVRFPGSDLHAEADEVLSVDVDRASPAYVVAPRGLEALSDVVPLVFAMVVISIWTTFAYVLLQVVLIRRGRTRSTSSVTGSTRSLTPGKEGPK